MDDYIIMPKMKRMVMLAFFLVFGKYKQEV